MAPLSATAILPERIVRFPRQRILGVSLAFLLASGPLLGQPLGRPGLRGKSDTLPDSPALKIPAAEQNEATGIVRGTISDSTGVMVAGARLILTHDDQERNRIEARLVRQSKFLLRPQRRRIRNVAHKAINAKRRPPHTAWK